MGECEGWESVRDGRGSVDTVTNQCQSFSRSVES